MGKQQAERHKYWQGVIAEQEASGKSIREFCRERNFRRTFVLLVAAGCARGGAGCVRAGGDETAAAPAAKFELALASGEVLRIPADVESLRVVFEVLRAAR